MPAKHKAPAAALATNARPEVLRRVLQHTNLTSAAELCSVLGCSQPTLSRSLAILGDEVVRLGRARATRYALARPLGRLGHRWPLHRIDEQGRASAAGSLVAAGVQGLVWEPPDDTTDAGFVWASMRPNQPCKGGAVQPVWFAGWPWFLQSLWPSGFMGRALARRCAAGGWVPPELSDWGTDDVLWMALMQGHEAPGHWVLGEVSLQRALASIVEPRDVMAASERATLYPLMAQAALQGEGPAAWVGGSQPCFTAIVRGDSAAGERPTSNPAVQALTSAMKPTSAGKGALPSAVRSSAARGLAAVATINLAAATVPAPRQARDLRACVVKFSDRAPTPAGQRWADLLRCESIACSVLSEHGIPAAQCEVIKAAGRVFLEVERIDRNHLLGRLGVIGVTKLQAQLPAAHRQASRWQRIQALCDQGWLSADDASLLIKRCLYAALIGVDEPHEESACLYLQAQRPFPLAPAVGLCPTTFAPKANGEVGARWLEVAPPPRVSLLRPWQEAAAAADLFWRRVMGSPGISLDFKVIVEDATRKLETARHRWR